MRALRYWLLLAIGLPVAVWVYAVLLFPDRGGEEEPTLRPAPPPSAEAPPGMVVVPRGTAIVGTSEERLAELLEDEPPRIRRDFAHESPPHTVPMPRFFLDRCEVTNEQYHVFLMATAATSFRTEEHGLTLLEVAGQMTHTPEAWWENDDVAWRQLYRANRARLLDARPDLVLKDSRGGFDDAKTEAAFRRAALPAGVVLRFYDRKPPETWPDLAPAPETLDLPVSSVSYVDAEAFALWAAKHVPTETEWEYAARGPAGRRYPWGEAWHDDVSHANWGRLDRGPAGTPPFLPVESLPAGVSWCGAHHLLGNAAEWTASWFQAYPGDEREHPYMGEFVKVIRGASCSDVHPLALRLAARNFMGLGVRKPPRPANRFAYVGFRCARYEEPGRSLLAAIARRATEDRSLRAKHLALDRYASAVRLPALPTWVRNHVTMSEGAFAVVVIPLEDVGICLRNRGDALVSLVWNSAFSPIPLAVVHANRPLAGREAGTWILVLHQGRLGLATADLGDVVPVPRAGTNLAALDAVLTIEAPRPPARLVLDADAGAVRISLATWLNASILATIEDLVLPLPDGVPADGEWRLHSR